MVEHLIIADGTRRERSNELVDRLNLARGERWHIAVPCGVGPGLDPAVRTVGINDLDGALDALDRVADGATLAIEGVDYWCMGPAEPMGNPDNDPDLARWNAIMRRAERACPLPYEAGWPVGTGAVDASHADRLLIGRGRTAVGPISVGFPVRRLPSRGPVEGPGVRAGTTLDFRIYDKDAGALDGHMTIQSPCVLRFFAGRNLVHFLDEEDG